MAKTTARDGRPKIDRVSPIPLYLQIRQRLLPQIVNWSDPATKFYSDEELAAWFAVSKMTVRQALGGLVEDGYLERTRGRGTFVRTQVFEERLSPRMDIESQYESAGHSQSIDLDEYGEIAASAAHAGRLRLNEGDPVLYLRRVRSVAGVPVAVDERWIPAHLARRAGFRRRVAAGSIFERMKRSFTLVRLDWQIAIQPANHRDAALLLVDRASPLLARSMVYVAQGERPVLHGLTVHRGDMARYSVSLPVGGDTGRRRRAGERQSRENGLPARPCRAR